ncbi:transcriptional regulator, XRE family [Rhizobium sp. RU33A]|uniref:helix-turn-helix domain-containing protein n=1 Tax=Rhizobium sp. RU33A TaxID=1907413 RepID=UPI000954BE0C|nr:helix-turn-helix transcriptional regulator [Rhizobium sp. RU33A]SIQ92612.1 transcriptional regulator, XRE family [Rhizobium sp. RU33A]
MTKIRDLHEAWLEKPDYRDAYDALEDEFSLIRAVVEARLQAGLTQAELAERMQTSQSAVARLESGRVKPSATTLEKLARATGTRLKISFEPVLDTISSS